MPAMGSRKYLVSGYKFNSNCYTNMSKLIKTLWSLKFGFSFDNIKLLPTSQDCSESIKNEVLNHISAYTDLLLGRFFI